MPPGQAQVERGEGEAEDAVAGGEQLVRREPDRGHDRGQLGGDLEAGGLGAAGDELVAGGPAVLEEVAVGLGPLGEEAEEGGQEVLEATAGGERHPGGVLEADAQLDEQLLGDGGEERRPALREVVVEEALGDLGDVGDLGEAGVLVAGGGEDGARRRRRSRPGARWGSCGPAGVPPAQPVEACSSMGWGSAAMVSLPSALHPRTMLTPDQHALVSRGVIPRHLPANTTGRQGGRPLDQGHQHGVALAGPQNAH